MPEGKEIFLFGYASSLAGARLGAAKGPLRLQLSDAMTALQSQNLALHWQPFIQAPTAPPVDKIRVVADLCKTLSRKISHVVSQGRFFVVLGGDHSCAIGTWGGVAASLKSKNQTAGLIWIDAHMDSHTPETSPSGNLHGMPVAVLLGQGDPLLTGLSGLTPVLRPEHLCLVGVRSFESGEAALLKRLGVRIFFMDEVRQRGLPAVLQDAKKIVTTGTDRYGISLDVDSIDPQDAPGTGVAEPGGLAAEGLCAGLALFANDPLLVGIEIAEFDPELDKNSMTEKLVPKLIAAITVGS